MEVKTRRNVCRQCGVFAATTRGPGEERDRYCCRCEGAQSRELSKLGTRHAWEFRSFFRMLESRRLGAALTLRERACGWSPFNRVLNFSTGRSHQSTTSGFPPRNILWEPSTVATAARLPSHVLLRISQVEDKSRARLCYFLNVEKNHGRNCYKLLDEGTGKYGY